MELEDYLKMTGLSGIMLAKICGVSHTTIYNYLKYGKFSKKTAKRIKFKTNGKVDLYENLSQVQSEADHN